MDDRDASWVIYRLEGQSMDEKPSLKKGFKGF